MSIGKYEAFDTALKVRALLQVCVFAADSDLDKSVFNEGHNALALSLEVAETLAGDLLDLVDGLETDLGNLKQQAG